MELGDFDSKSLLQSDLETYAQRYNRKVHKYIYVVCMFYLLPALLSPWYLWR